MCQPSLASTDQRIHILWMLKVRVKKSVQSNPCLPYYNEISEFLYSPRAADGNLPETAARWKGETRVWGQYLPFKPICFCCQKLRPKSVFFDKLFNINDQKLSAFTHTAFTLERFTYVAFTARQWLRPFAKFTVVFRSFYAHCIYIRVWQQNHASAWVSIWLGFPPNADIFFFS